MVRDLSSPKVEDELNKNVGQWNQTKPEEEKDHLINTKHGILVPLNSRRRWPPDEEEFSRKDTNKANHNDRSPSYLKEAAGPGEGNLSGECLF